MTSFGSSLRRAAAIACLLAATWAAAAVAADRASAAEPEPSPADCVAAAARAERMYDLPTGLLRAIGEVESGLLDRGTGRIAPWPWAVDEAGAGQFFPSAESAIAYVAGQLVAGTRNIDVGCFQISLLYHADAFTSLEQAFDPAANAEAAARLLVALRTRAGSWEEAAGLYHSATPWRAAPYRDLVMRRWTGVASDGATLFPGWAMPTGGVVVRVILPAWAVRSEPRSVTTRRPLAASIAVTRVPARQRRGLPIVQTPSRAPSHG